MAGIGARPMQATAAQGFQALANRGMPTSPAPVPGFWKDASRKDIPVGSTGNPNLDMLNFSMPAGTEFGNINHGGGFFGTTGQGGMTDFTQQRRR